MKHIFVQFGLMMLMMCGTVRMHGQELDFEIVRDGCMDSPVDDVARNRAAVDRMWAGLVDPRKDWDPTRTYHQLVVLVEFSDMQFDDNRDADFYDMMFNEFSTDLFEGYTRYGKGCVSDYFRDQSSGMLNLEFDVLGPYKVDAVARPTQNRDNKSAELRSATLQMVAQETERDFSQYDWNGDGYIEQVIYVCAGPTGNITSGGVSYVGYLHPNTSSFATVTTHDNLKISNYSASAERWTLDNNANCGIGTICHEFSHCLGMADLYNTYSYDVVVDDWNLMDGGNGINYGWCPPNYSPFERMLLGWLDPVELTEPVSISGLLPLSEGGNVYIVYHTSDEFYLLENRQQRGWDEGVPGSGLVVWHVNYSRSRWLANTPNNYSDLGMQLVHADNMDVNEWTDYILENGLSLYTGSQRMRSRRLSSSPYPYVAEDASVVDSLTDYSVPASVMYNTNDVGSVMLSKAISNISVSEDGVVSFDFMGGTPTGITEVSDVTKGEDGVWYDLMGRRVVNMEKGRMYVGKRGKVFKVDN